MNFRNPILQLWGYLWGYLGLPHLTVSINRAKSRNLRGEMGGRGSTRWGYREPRPIVEDCRCTLDTDHFHSAGLFTPPLTLPQSGALFWQAPASMTFTLESNSAEGVVLTLIYALGDKPIHLPILLQQTHLPSGGLRWWFTCPISCNRRVRKLYLPPGRAVYGCWHCYGLTHECRRAGYNWRARLCKAWAAKSGKDIREVRAQTAALRRMLK